MLALSQSAGSLPVSSDRWKMSLKAGAIWSAHSLRMRFGMLSGPGDFWGLSSCSSFLTPAVVMLIGDIGGCVEGGRCGGLFGFCVVNTDLNC